VAGAIALLKGLADALNPMLSRHHAACAGRKEPGHRSPPAAPATRGAVLTVPPEAMVAVYPGGGCRLAPHVDNSYSAESDRRWNARELTAIIYATPPDWNPERDGGALLVYPHSTDSRWGEPVRIDPLGGRLVVFFSCFRHEVAPAFRTRRAMQLWIFRPDVATAEGTDGPGAAPAQRPGRIWRVVGDAQRPGLVAREGKEPDSRLLPGQLRGGARLQELEVSGGRLRFRNLGGEGPESGWVLIAAKTGERLLEPEPAA